MFVNLPGLFETLLLFQVAHTVIMVTTVERFVRVTLTTQNYATLTMERAPAGLVGKEGIARSMWTNVLMKTCTSALHIRPVRT